MNPTPSARDQIVTLHCRSPVRNVGLALPPAQPDRARGRAPKGSLYHYFPGGKDELAIEALRLLGQRTEERLRATLALAEDPGAAVGAWARALAGHLRDWPGGAGSIAAIALETSGTNPALNTACREVYRLWQDAYRDALSRFGCRLGRGGGGVRPRRHRGRPAPSAAASTARRSRSRRSPRT